MCLLLGTVTKSSLSKSDLWALGMATKKLKLEEEAITEILVSDWFRIRCWGYRYRRRQATTTTTTTNNNTASLSTRQTTGCNKWRSITTLRTASRKEQMFILSSVQQKVRKRVRPHTSTKTAHHCLCWCFSQKFFICWWNRPTYITSHS